MRDEIPQAGFRAAALTSPMRAAPDTARIREKPKAPILIPVHFDRIFTRIPTGYALRWALGA